LIAAYNSNNNLENIVQQYHNNSTGAIAKVREIFYFFGSTGITGRTVNDNKRTKLNTKQWYSQGWAWGGTCPPNFGKQRCLLSIAVVYKRQKGDNFEARYSRYKR